MIIYKKSDQLSSYLSQQKKSGRKIGFIPTMGALHEGHISLLQMARDSDDLTICSIFVNPTQFNNPDDLKHYPVTIEKDIELLHSNHCSILFLPSVEEIYPPEHIKKTYPLGEMETILEGKYRPGHFQGVSEVVERLLKIVHPDHLYMGQKDFQQCMVINKLIQILHLENQIKLIIAPTLREKDGLAMSSRNQRLNQDERNLSTAIYKELSQIKKEISTEEFSRLKEKARKNLESKGFKVDYIEISHVSDLSPAPNYNQRKLVVLAAAYIGKIRLIDNLLLN